MKRSEAVNELHVFLSENHSGFNADLVLEFIEKHLKMAPPFDRAIPTENDVAWMRAQGYHEDGTLLNKPYKPPQRKWENE